MFPKNIATGAASQQRTHTPPDTRSCPISDMHLFWCWDHSFLNLSFLRTSWGLNIPRFFYCAYRPHNHLVNTKTKENGKIKDEISTRVWTNTELLSATTIIISSHIPRSIVKYRYIGNNNSNSTWSLMGVNCITSSTPLIHLLSAVTLRELYVSALVITRSRYIWPAYP